MDVTVLILVGLFVGIVGGMFGIGGGIILIPTLNEVLGPNQHLYQSTAMIVNLFVAVPAVYQHQCARAIDFRTVLRVTALSIPAVLLGVGISELRVFSGEGEAYLRGIFGAFLLACAAYDAYRFWRRMRMPTQADSVATGATSWSALAAVAGPTGFLSGFLGIGGGIVAVPLQRRVLHLPIRNAIANSAAIIVATSLVGAIFKNYAYLRGDDAEAQPLLLAAVLVPTAVAGSLLGSRLVHRIPIRLTRAGFILILLVASVRLMWTALLSIRAL